MPQFHGKSKTPMAPIYSVEDVTLNAGSRLVKDGLWIYETLCNFLGRA